ncbi:MAG: ROK family transcriptional regulator [Phycisphaerales bacterium]|nr:ROK family transcriptional regulator [Phycisphaerales bacterium]MBT7170750.1 ROK family transcriptional regulator [Phycisphaerales bacterium]
MSPMRKVNQSIAAVHNRRMVLNLFRRHGILSQKVLVELTGLRVSTLSNMVRGLQARDLLRVVGKKTASTPGKRQVLLGINPDRGAVLGLSVSQDAVQAAWCNSAGEILTQQQIPFTAQSEELPKALAAVVGELRDEFETPEMPLLGVGVGSTGVIDADAGMILHSIFLGLNHFPLRELLVAELDLPVFVENDIRCATLAELVRREDTEPCNLLYNLVLLVEDPRNHLLNAGVCWCENDRIYRGNTHSAGEMMADPFSDKFPELVSDDLALLADEDTSKPLTSSLKITLERLADGLMRLVDLLDPAEIVLGSNICWANRKAINYLGKQINRQALPIPGRAIKISPALMFCEGAAFGAALGVIEQLENLLIQDDE